MRRFNVTGLCASRKHYMVDIGGKLAQIRAMVDYGDYFTINRARQYGKTTTLSLLRRMLKDDYTVAFISFEGLGDESFETPLAFCGAFMRLIQRALGYSGASEDYSKSWYNEDVTNFEALNHHITEMCRDRKFVLMIDEVDKTSSNRTYLHFLGMLRSKYLEREDDMGHTFHSVILAGVYDIKNLKLKMINEGAYTSQVTEGKLYNSPWNIAASFDVDMSFSPAEIATMLAEYESEQGLGMDIHAIANEIYSYTNGYPFLVSRICKEIDEKNGKDWTAGGVHDAVQTVLEEKNMLFDDMFKNIESNSELYDFLYRLLFIGTEFSFKLDDPLIDLGNMYGFLTKGDRNKTKIANKIFETRIYEYFLSKNETSRYSTNGYVIQSDVVQGGRFDMALCLWKFAEHYAEMYSERDAKFMEREGRMLFLTFLRPLINGHGFYHIESQLTDLRRMDIVVDFGKDQFVVELKLWKGEASHEKAYGQLAGYLDSKGMDTGYLLTFDFRKGITKQPYSKWIEYGGKRIYDVVV